MQLDILNLLLQEERFENAEDYFIACIIINEIEDSLLEDSNQIDDDDNDNWAIKPMKKGR